MTEPLGNEDQPLVPPPGMRIGVQVTVDMGVTPGGAAALPAEDGPAGDDGEPR